VLSGPHLAGRSAGWLTVVYALYALVACALLCVNMPPFQNADELNHFLRADNISRGALIAQRYQQVNSGGLASPGITEAAAPFEVLKFRPDLKATRAMYAAARASWQQPGILIAFPNTALNPPYFYAPSVAAIWFGKAGRMSVIQTLYLARLLTGVTCCLGIAWALLICSRAGLTGAALLIFALATLPMSLALQNAASQDGLMLVAAALAASWFARLRVLPAAGGFVPMCLSLALVAAARPPYVALALIPLVLPLPWRRRLLGAGCIAVACASWSELNTFYVSIYAIPDYQARIAAQARLLFDPARDIYLAIATFHAHAGDYARQFIGELGWLDVRLPTMLIRAEWALLACLVLASVGRPSGAALAVILATLLGAAATFAAQYLTWTEPGATIVDGVQGRYFLAFALVLAGLATTLARGRFGRTAMLVTAAFPIATIGIALRAIVVRYYIGP